MIAVAGASLVPICKDVVVDPATTPDERARLAHDVPLAFGELRAALGEPGGAAPMVVVCKTISCQRAFAGDALRSYVLSAGERLPGASFVPNRTTVVIVRSDPEAEHVLVHELVHVELVARLGREGAPAWFHEGIAAHIANAPRCPPGATAGIDDLRRLERPAAWLAYTNQPNTIVRTYCQARREVEAWLAHDSRDRLTMLVNAVRGGTGFADAYGALVTQPAAPLTTIVMSPAGELGDPGRPFTLALRIRPTATAGVLAHVSTSEAGVGWCMPLLGYDAAGRIVAQLPRERGPELGHFVVATDTVPRAPGSWHHVAMTWAPGGSLRLYVDGALAAEAASATRDGPGTPLYVTWGLSNAGGGPSCWAGAIAAAAFAGSIADMRVSATASSASEIATLAAPPSP